MEIRGKLAHILLDISPKHYETYIAYENRKVVRYLKLLKHLDGVLIESLQLCQKLRKDLESI